MEGNKSDLSVVINETAPCCIEMSVTVSASRVNKIYERVLAKLASQVKLPGFRAGKVPAKILQSRYSEGINAETVEQLMNDTLFQAAKENGYQLASRAVPQGEPVFKVGEEFSYKVAVEVEPKFELPQYKGLQLTKESCAVEESAVEELLNNLADSRSTYEKVDRAAAAKDMVKANYTTDADEALREAEGCKYLLSGENSWLALREPAMLPNVETILNGVSAGDHKDAEIEFPADFRVEALRGKKVTYHFDILEVHGFVPAVVNDDFAKEMKFDDLAAMKEQIRTSMKQRKEAEATEKMQQQAMTLLCSDLKFDLPPTVLKDTTENVKNDLKSKEGKDVKLDEAAEQALAEKAAKEATDLLRKDYLMSRIAEAENIQVSQEQVHEAIEMFAYRYGQKPEQVMKDLSKNGHIYALLENIRKQNVMKFIVDNANAVEA